MKDGNIQQDGTPEQVYGEPANTFVYDFLGRSSQIAGQVRGGVFHPDGSQATFPCAGVADGPGCLYARPHDIRLSDTDGIDARVTEARRLAGRGLLMLEMPQQARPLELDIGHDIATIPAEGDLVRVRPSRYRVFPAA